MTNAEIPFFTFKITPDTSVQLYHYPDPQLDVDEVEINRVDSISFGDDGRFLGTVAKLSDGTWRARNPDFQELAASLPTMRQAVRLVAGVPEPKARVKDMNDLMGDLAVRMLELYPSDDEVPFTPTRFPYTYAADCLRNYPELVPADVRTAEFPPDSRAAAAHQETIWAHEKGIHRALLSMALAVTFCQREGIKVDPARYSEFLSEVLRGEHNG